MKENLKEVLEVAKDLNQWNLFSIVEHYTHSDDGHQSIRRIKRAINKLEAKELLEAIKDGVIGVNLESGYHKKIIDIEITNDTFRYQGIQSKPKVKELVGKTGQLSLF